MSQLFHVESHFSIFMLAVEFVSNPFITLDRSTASRELPDEI